MIATRIVMLCLTVVLAAPTVAYSAAATCDDFANCFQDENNPCDLGDMYLGITLGTVDGIGELLCFVGDPKCGCFGAITDPNGTGPEFDQWSSRLRAEIDSCAGTSSGGRSLSGVAFGAANELCSGGGSPSFETDVKPILEASCGVCHISGSSGNFNMTNGLADLLDVPSNQSSFPYVQANAADSSYLFHKIEGTHLDRGGSGSRMPLGGMLPMSDIDTIRNWINGGANP